MTSYDTLFHFIAGISAGMSSVAAGHPLDTLKANKQSQLSNPRLFSGMIYPFFATGIQNSFNFGVYHIALNNTNNHYLSGAISGAIVSPFVSIFELYKIKAQNKITMPLSLYRGMKLTCLRETIGYGLYFDTYERIKRYLLISKYSQTVSCLTAGGIAGVNSWLWTYPIDTIKTEVQSGKSFYNVLKTYKKAPINLFRGFSYCIMRAFFCNMIGFYFYEETLKILHTITN